MAQTKGKRITVGGKYFFRLEWYFFNLGANPRKNSSIFLFARLLCSFACTLQALQHQVVRVQARKKEANKLKRQANKKIKKQTRQSGQTQQQAHAAIEITDEPAEYV